MTVKILSNVHVGFLQRKQQRYRWSINEFICIFQRIGRHDSATHRSKRGSRRSRPQFDAGWNWHGWVHTGNYAFVLCWKGFSHDVIESLFIDRPVIVFHKTGEARYLLRRRFWTFRMPWLTPEKRMPVWIQNLWVWDQIKYSQDGCPAERQPFRSARFVEEYWEHTEIMTHRDRSHLVTGRGNSISQWIMSADIRIPIFAVRLQYTWY